MVNSRDSEPWSFGEEVEDISRNYIKLRYRLMPYLYSVFYESTQNGMPVSRSLAIDYTFDPFIYSDPYQNQYLFGPSLLVIPAESYKQFIKAYFPEGAWYSLYTDSIQAGGTEEIIDNSKEYLPVYVKAGSILLMQESTSNLLKQQTVETLEIHIYPGGNMEFDYYEDDGETYRYLDGQNLTRKFKLQEKKLHISDSCGSHHSHFKNWIVYVHGSGIHSITINGVQHQVEYTNYRFVQPVSDFDPYHKPPQAPVEIEHLAMIRTVAITQEVLIEWA
jgi:alpha-glucosidase